MFSRKLAGALSVEKVIKGVEIIRLLWQPWCTALSRHGGSSLAVSVIQYDFCFTVSCAKSIIFKTKEAYFSDLKQGAKRIFAAFFVKIDHFLKSRGIVLFDVVASTLKVEDRHEPGST
jgi:hypothetical protein